MEGWWWWRVSPGAIISHKLRRAFPLFPRRRAPPQAQQGEQAVSSHFFSLCSSKVSLFLTCLLLCSVTRWKVLGLTTTPFLQHQRRVLQGLSSSVIQNNWEHIHTWSFLRAPHVPRDVNYGVPADGRPSLWIRSIQRSGRWKDENEDENGFSFKNQTPVCFVAWPSKGCFMHQCRSMRAVVENSLRQGCCWMRGIQPQCKLLTTVTKSEKLRFFLL